MTLNRDTSTPIRTLARYRELVTGILDAPTATQETYWVEWKSQADVSEKRWAAELSRQVLAFANRDPEAAGKWFGGCAYIVVGVSPGALTGAPVHDTAKIEDWLTPYIGRAPNAPEWAPTYVDVQNNQVLVLTVEPPQFGHPAWPCRKSYSPNPRNPSEEMKLSVRDGAVYVRHKASTEEAKSADIEMLSRRASGSRRRIAGISLILAPGSRAASLDANDDTVTAWAERERETFKPPPPAPPRTQTVSVAGTSLSATAELMAELSDQVTKGSWEPDTRTPEAYQKEVDTYIAKATKVLPALVIKRAYERRLGRIGLSVHNNTDDPIRQLQVELVIAAKGVMAVSEDVDVPDVSLPKRPIMLGKAGRSRFGALDAISLSGLRVPAYERYMSPAIRAIGRGVKIDNSDSAHLTFDPLDLYPQETAELEEFYLFTSIDHTGTILTAEWSARARDVSGVIRDTLEIEVDAAVPTIEELLAEHEEEDRGEDDED